MADNDALLKELLETFRVEAQDHLDQLGLLLVALEKEQEPALQGQQVEGIFRRMHTLKGAAHAVNLIDVAHTCQELESLISDLKRGAIALDGALFDRLHRDIDLLTARIFAPAQKAPDAQVSGAPAGRQSTPQGAAPGQQDEKHARPGVPTGEKALQEAAGTPQETSAAPAAVTHAHPHAHERREPAHDKVAPETVRVPTRLLESLLLQAEELVSAKLAASVLNEELSAAALELTGRQAARSRALESAGTMLRTQGGELAAARLAALVQDFCETERRTEQRLKGMEQTAERSLRALRAMINPLLDEMKKLHLLPFSTLTDPFPKVIRDLGRELNKAAELTVSGGELELDRRILAELKEPLLHIMRNIMDHGIESASQRAGRGKPPRGRISIDLRLKDANHAEITVSDDGAGIDPERVKGTALRLELINQETYDRMGEAEALQLIFESGFSTSTMITSFSGRGVGLAIVREALERLGGGATVESSLGNGVAFRLRVPLSFALIRGLKVETGGRACILPAANVVLSSQLPREEIRTVENRETVLLGGELFSLVSLASVLELGERGVAEHEANQQVVLLTAGDRRIAFAVDQVAEVQEVLVKPLGNQLSRVRNVAGATVLGDGRVVPILNINDLMRSALLGPGRGLLREAEGAPRKRRMSVLVAEDSITSRTLLKNILEASGYRVVTAIDGVDALTQLKTGEFDIVVSDVEMPRLDGFGLTAAIRGENKWKDLPVILVTGLESRSDRERGIEVGANAYVVKSSFDQTGLIDVIQKLTGA